mgnify:FL=1|jgi:hypothetical protein
MGLGNWLSKAGREKIAIEKALQRYDTSTSKLGFAVDNNQGELIVRNHWQEAFGNLLSAGNVTTKSTETHEIDPALYERAAEITFTAAQYVTEHGEGNGERNLGNSLASLLKTRLELIEVSQKEAIHNLPNLYNRENNVDQAEIDLIENILARTGVLERTQQATSTLTQRFGELGITQDTPEYSLEKLQEVRTTVDETLTPVTTELESLGFFGNQRYSFITTDHAILDTAVVAPAITYGIETFTNLINSNASVDNTTQAYQTTTELIEIEQDPEQRKRLNGNLVSAVRTIAGEVSQDFLDLTTTERYTNGETTREDLLEMRAKANNARAYEELVGIDEELSESPYKVLNVLTMTCPDLENEGGNEIDIIEIGKRFLRDIKAMELDDANYVPSEEPGKTPSPSLTTITAARDIMNTYMGGWNTELKKVGHNVNIAPFSDEIFTTTVNYGIRVIGEIAEAKKVIVEDFQQFYRTTNSCIGLVKNHETRTALEEQLETTVTGMYNGVEEARQAIKIPNTEEYDSDEQYEARTNDTLEALDPLIAKGLKGYLCLQSIKEKEIAKRDIGGLTTTMVNMERTVIGVIGEEITYLETEDDGPDKDVTAENPDRLLTLYSQAAMRYKRINDKPNAINYTRLARARINEAEMNGLEEIDEADERELNPNEVLRLDELYRALEMEYRMLGDNEQAAVYSGEITGLYNRVAEARDTLEIQIPTLQATLSLDGAVSFDLLQQEPDETPAETE